MNDTATNTAIPYIIRYYTKEVNTHTETDTFYEETNKYNKVTDAVADLDGRDLYIAITKNNLETEKYCVNTANYSWCGEYSGITENGLKKVDIANAVKWHFELIESNKYYVYYEKNSTKNYMVLIESNNMKTSTNKSEATQFQITRRSSGIDYLFNNGSNVFINLFAGSKFSGWTTGEGDSGSYITLVDPNYEVVKVPKTVDYEVSEGYNARCVTSTKGYYDINLTGNEPYYLPDSFRGIGSVGYYDHYDNTVSNHIKDSRQLYRMNVDCFNGYGKTIDEDIYLNRYCDQKDNFFDSLHRTTTCTQDYQSMSTYNFKINNAYSYYSLNSNTENHGIGLFDSIFMRDESSSFKNFTLTGSLNTENYSLGTSATGEKVEKAEGGLTDGKVHWLATGGVCGASPSASWCNFEKVTLSNLSVSGATQTGGLLGHSGLNGIAQKILVTECNAVELSVEITCSNATNDNDNKFRCALGGFVGKAKEGYVVVQGGTSGSIVKLKKFNAEQNRLNIVTGGLVAYAGAGCQAYNMTVMPADSLANTDTVITIGGSGVGMSGGIVGLMQPSSSSGAPLKECVAEFENCKLTAIPV